MKENKIEYWPVGEGAQGGAAVEDDDDQDVGHGGEEEEQCQQNVDEDTQRGRNHRALHIDRHRAIRSIRHRAESMEIKLNVNVKS